MIARASRVLVLLSTPLVLAAFAGPDEARYEACLDRVSKDADQAFEDALAWQTLGGGVPAEHCAALALIELGHAGEAAARLEKLAATPGGHGADLRFALLEQAADAWVVAGDAVKAMSALSRAAALAGDAGLGPEPQASAYARRAEIAAATGFDNEAMRDADSAIATSPSAEAYAVRARLLRRLNRRDEAARDLENALHLESGNPEALYERGLLHLDRLEIDSARKDFLAVILAGENHPMAELARRELEQLDIKGE